MSIASPTLTSDLKLDGLEVDVKDATTTLEALMEKHTKFQDLEKEQIFSTSLKGSDKLTIGTTQLGATASATYQATVVPPNGNDSDRILTTNDTKGDSAWLKQKLALEAKVKGEEGPLTFGLATVSAEGSAKANLRLLDYRRHKTSDPVGQAVIDAIEGARFAVRVEDVRQLDANSRLAVIAGGQLALNVKLSVADTLSTGLAVLDKTLGVTAPVNIETGGTCDLMVGLSDDFRLVFSRAESQSIRVDVKKAIRKQVRLTGKYEVKAVLAKPEALAAALGTYIRERLGVSYEDYKKLEKAISNVTVFSALPPSLQEVAKAVAGKLGLGDVEKKLSDLKARICGLDKKLDDALQEVVRARVEAAFTFSWSRVKSYETLLSFEVDPKTLPDYLNERLLFGNLSQVLDALADKDKNPGLTLLNYLETKKDTISRGFGFSLSLGPWSVGSKIKLEKDWQTEWKGVEEASPRRLALCGRCIYHADWLGGQKETYFTDLGASMPDFADKPTLAAFKLGLHLSWTWQDLPDQAARWADLAELWTGLAKKHSGNDKGEAVVEAVLRHEGVMEVAKAAFNNDPLWMESWSWALAAALPPISALKLRTSVEDRIRLYHDSAKDLLKKRNEDVETVTKPSHYTQEERIKLLPIDMAGLGEEITPYAQKFEMFTLKTLWRPTNDARKPWTLFERTRNAFAALASDKNDCRSSIEDLLSELYRTVNDDPFSMRLLGAALTHYLRQTGNASLFTASARYETGGLVTLAGTAS